MLGRLPAQVGDELGGKLVAEDDVHGGHLSAAGAAAGWSLPTAVSVVTLLA
jgi:hypothetical protein